MSNNPSRASSVISTADKGKGPAAPQDPPMTENPFARKPQSLLDDPEYRQYLSWRYKQVGAEGFSTQGPPKPEPLSSAAAPPFVPPQVYNPADEEYPDVLHTPEHPTVRLPPSAPPSPAPITSGLNPALVASNVKLDKIKPLTGHDNYEQWAQQMRFVFLAMGIAIVVIDGVKCIPNYAEVTSQALLVYIQVLSDNIFFEISRITDPHEIWIYLEKTYRRDSAFSFVAQLGKLGALACTDSIKNPTAFISNFEKEFARFETLCSAPGSSAYRTDMRRAFAHDEAKRDLLLSAFQRTYPNPVDNLTTKDNLTFAQAKDKLLGLADNKHPRTNQSVNQSSNQSVRAADYKPKVPPLSSGSASRTVGTSSKVLECSWCKKHSPATAQGHFYK